jgi:sugar-specific transcriptional regulator TrmB
MFEILESIQFDEKEANIYVALLKEGNSSVSELLKHTKIERRTIYDVLERLIQKGRVSYYVENNVRKYDAIDPEVILDEYQRKGESFKKIIPNLQSLHKVPKDAKVEILKGVQGLNIIFHEIINGKHEHFAFGDISPFISEEKYKRVVNKFLLHLKEQKLKEKIIHEKGQPVKKIPQGTYKGIEREFIPPSPTIIYGNVITQYIYTDPLTIIKITSKEIAQTHKEYFNYFWKLAK